MILRAAWIAPVASPPIRDGYVHVLADRIIRVGRAADPDAPLGDATMDLGDSVVTPGLVNPHTHLELTCYAGRLAPQPFWHWISELIKLRSGDAALRNEADSVAEGAWQSLRAGVTCIGDISRTNCAWRPLKAIPIRKVCFVELLSIAEWPPRNPAELRAEFDRIEEDDLLTAGVTPHAPYTVPIDHFRAALALAAERRRPWTTHWAETREEIAFLKGDASQLPPRLAQAIDAAGIRPRAADSIAYLNDCTRAAPFGSLAHLNYLQDAEIDRLAAGGHVAIYCPRAHHYFGHRDHPWKRLLQAGIEVAIGTDSLASNDSLSILEELQFLCRRPASAPPEPAALLRMATLSGARALGLADRIGAIEPGKQADFAAFPVSARCDDPIRELIEKAPRPTAVWVAGRQVS